MESRNEKIVRAAAAVITAAAPDRMRSLPGIQVRIWERGRRARHSGNSFLRRYDRGVRFRRENTPGKTEVTIGFSSDPIPGTPAGFRLFRFAAVQYAGQGKR